MIKRISLVRRREGMSRDDFVAHWTGPHSEIVRAMPGVRGLRYDVVHSWSPNEAAWDGVGEIWFDSLESAEAAFSAEPYASMLAQDRQLFLGESQFCFVEELTVIEPPSRA
jgi:uncharacterized protein (TIGR02118 family)